MVELEKQPMSLHVTVLYFIFFSFLPYILKNRSELKKIVVWKFSVLKDII